MRSGPRLRLDQASASSAKELVRPAQPTHDCFRGKAIARGREIGRALGRRSDHLYRRDEAEKMLVRRDSIDARLTAAAGARLLLLTECGYVEGRINSVRECCRFVVNAGAMNRRERTRTCFCFWRPMKVKGLGRTFFGV
jgi:hypothetical protein